MTKLIAAFPDLRELKNYPGKQQNKASSCNDARWLGVPRRDPQTALGSAWWINGRSQGGIHFTQGNSLLAVISPAKCLLLPRKCI